mmetsp:Transcript_121642/g.211303  ORF Transcript_121642/g.211303 Transcript_121642/m.211303 type:complete len:305 (-) Transcript_121642:525-1439(-)
MAKLEERLFFFEVCLNFAMDSKEDPTTLLPSGLIAEENGGGAAEPAPEAEAEAEAEAGAPKAAKVKTSWKETMAKLEERRKKKYAELYGESPASPPTTAWEMENGVFICHATQQVFTTGAQVRDHCRTAEYRLQLSESGLAVDASLMQFCENHAKVAKEKRKAAVTEKLEQQSKVQQTELATVKAQMVQAAKENRILSHEHRQLTQKLAKQTKQCEHWEGLVNQLLEKKQKTAEQELIHRQSMAKVVDENRVLRQERHALRMELDMVKKAYKRDTGSAPPVYTPTAPAPAGAPSAASTEPAAAS